jgi:3D (Asp-Asp-Asp) domain-containing protein
MQYCTYAMLVMALVLGACEGSSPIAHELTAPTVEIAPAAPEPVAAAPEPRPDPERDRMPLGGPIGSFRFTMYFVAVEPPPETDDATLAATTLSSGAPDTLSGEPDTLSGGPDTTTIYIKKGCKPLATVSKDFGKKLDIQGSGKLRDGRVVNVTGVCRCPNSPCYKEIKAAWAWGAGGRLTPFRSVAIDTRLIKLGTVLYVPELDGMRMPGKSPWGGFVHDGCVVAADRGGGIQGHELDFFVAKKAFSDGLHARHRLKRVTVFDGKGWCEKKRGAVKKKAGG